MPGPPRLKVFLPGLFPYGAAAMTSSPSPLASAADADLPLTIEDVRAAAARISDAVVRTPTLHSKTLSKITGADVWLKFENLQFTAAYKERGALNALLLMEERARARGVILSSTSVKLRA